MIGILGGTFDPIHNGHLYIANEAAAAFSCAKVVFVPCRHPTHRDDAMASAGDRANMVKLAIEDNPLFAFSNVELERPRAILYDRHRQNIN